MLWRSFLGNWCSHIFTRYTGTDGVVWSISLWVVSMEQRVVCLSGPSGYKRLLSLHGAGELKNGCLIAVKTIIYIAVLFANWFPIYELPGKGNALK